MHLGAGEADAFDGQIRAEQVTAAAVHPQAALGAVDEAVAQRQAGAAADAQGALVGLAEHAHVGDGRVGAGGRALVAFAVVRLDGVVGGIGLLDVEVLNAPGPAVRPVQGVVGVAGQHHMLGIYRAAEELHAIVEVVVDLYVVNYGGVAHPLKGNAVQLVFLIDVGAGEAHADIAQHAGVVAAVGAAEDAGVGLPLLGAGVGAAIGSLRAVVDGRIAVDDQAAPKAAVIALHIAHHLPLGGEDDGLLGAAIRHQGAASVDDQKVLRSAADDNAAGGHLKLAVRQIAAAAGRGAFRWRDPSGAAGNLKDVVVAEHQASGVEHAIGQRRHINGVDGLAAEAGVRGLPGIGDGRLQLGRDDRGHGHAVAAPAAISAVASIPAVAAIAAVSIPVTAAAFDGHLNHNGTRRSILRRAAASGQQKCGKRERGNPADTFHDH